MNEKNRKTAWHAMQRVGDRLVGRLPPCPHVGPKRNPHAHVAERVRSTFGCSYKDIPDERLPDLLGFISRLQRYELSKNHYDAKVYPD